MEYFKPQKGTRSTKHLVRTSFVLFVLFCGITSVKADDGYRLWLRYELLPARSLDLYRERIRTVSVQGTSPTLDAIRRELSVGCAGLLGTPIPVGDRNDASVVVGLPQTSPLIRKLRWDAELKSL
jgi:alpha-glucuronidase